MIQWQTGLGVLHPFVYVVCDVIYTSPTKGLRPFVCLAVTLLSLITALQQFSFREYNELIQSGSSARTESVKCNSYTLQCLGHLTVFLSN